MYTDDRSCPTDELGFDAGDDAVEPEFNPAGEVVPPATTAPPVARSVDTISVATTELYIANADLTGVPPAVVADTALALINREIQAQNNRIKDKDDPLIGPTIKQLGRLDLASAARLAAAQHRIVKLAPSRHNADPDVLALAAYDDDPASPRWGTYVTSETHLRSIVRRYSPNMTGRSFADIATALEDLVEVVTRGQESHLIAVRNGIVDQSDRDANGVPAFREFSPEHVFIAKLDVDWNPRAENVVIHNDEDDTDWDVESWMADFFPEVRPGNEGMTELLWQIVGASVRPYVSWNKCAFLYSAKGNNGKGTLVSLMRNVLGVSNYASIPLANLGKEFYLEPLTRASAILVDENDVGTFVEHAGNFKAIVTNDVITINRKNRAVIEHQHFGFMVQCLNDAPQIKDKSESLYRRQLFVKFTKSFTGAERKYIKDDYLTRPAVLEYVLKRVLTMDYDRLSEPPAVLAALDDFKVANDPVLAFWQDIAMDLTWDLQPFTYMYDLYKSWFAMNNPTGKPLSSQKFTDSLLSIIEGDDSEWVCEDRRRKHRPSNMMTSPQLLTVDYGLEGWINHSVTDKLNRRARATMAPDMFKEGYRGLRRRTAVEDLTAGFDIDAAGVPPAPTEGTEGEDI